MSFKAFPNVGFEGKGSSLAEYGDTDSKPEAEAGGQGEAPGTSNDTGLSGHWRGLGWPEVLKVSHKKNPTAIMRKSCTLTGHQDTSKAIQAEAASPRTQWLWTERASCSSLDSIENPGRVPRGRLLPISCRFSAPQFHYHINSHQQILVRFTLR